MAWFARVRPFLPWLSLATGTASAILMNRSPARAWIVVLAALLAWLLLLLLAVVERTVTEQHGAKGKAARFVVLLLSQMSIQQALLFPLPFYLRAATLHPRHAAFFVAYAVALTCSLWDPLYERVAKRRGSAIALFAFAAFVSLAMVLPVLSLSNGTAVIVAGVGAAIGVPMAFAVTSTTPKSLLSRLGVGVAVVVVVIAARFVAFLVPPAPLELVSCVIGTAIVDREVTGVGEELDQPAQIFCHSAIKAPLGLKDALVHRWSHDGAHLDDVPLDVNGGRNAGFRTWSKKSAPSRGRWTCTVQTTTGQVLGAASVLVR